MIIFQNSPRELTSSRRVSQGPKAIKAAHWAPQWVWGPAQWFPSSGCSSRLPWGADSVPIVVPGSRKMGCLPSGISVGCEWIWDSWWLLDEKGGFFANLISGWNFWRVFFGVYSFPGRFWFPRSSPNPPAGSMPPKCLDAWWVQPIPAFKMFMLCRIHRPNTGHEIPFSRHGLWRISMSRSQGP